MLHYGDLSDGGSLIRVVKDVQPQEIYNLAAQSHVKVSFQSPEYTSNVDALGTLRVLEAIVLSGLTERVRFYQASTSELFGNALTSPQNESTPFHPRSPYGVAKLYAHWITINYREAYGLFASTGILFNHESPIRGETFVTRKISRGVAEIEAGVRDCIYLGNLDAERDWGHARDFVKGMWQILQHHKPDDFVLATGVKHSVREFAARAFRCIGRDIAWEGAGTQEIGVDENSGQTLVRVDPRYFRPAEVDLLLGDFAKAGKELGWRPETDFAELVQEMVDGDRAIVSRTLITLS